MELIMIPKSGSLVVRTRSVESQGSFRGGKHSAALLHNPNQDVRMAMQRYNSECLLDDDGLQHIDTLLKSKDAVNDMGEHPDSKIQT